MVLNKFVSQDRALLDPAATAAAAGTLAELCQPGDVICLFGDLGAGKTTFARGFLRALGVVDEIPSPTFNLLLTYDTAAGTIWHFDLYRLNEPNEIIELGFEDAMADGISLIEWPDRLGDWLPERRIEIYLTETKADTCRQLSLRAMGAGFERWRAPW